MDFSIVAAAKELDIQGSADNDEQLRKIIIDRIRDLIHSDFQKLVNILYRMDVSESKLKRMLEENPESDAGVIIAELMIERQAQKIKSRQETRSNNKISDDEKW